MNCCLKVALLLGITTVPVLFLQATAQGTLAKGPGLTVQQAVAYAMAHRAELRASGSQVMSAEESRKQAGVPPNPRLLLRKEDFVNHPGLGEGSQTYYEGSELLETSGKRAGRLAVADQEVVRTRLQAEVDRRRIHLAVQDAYWHAAAQQSLAALYAEDDRFFDQTVAYHEARFKEGKLAEVDLLRVQLQGQQVHAAASGASLEAERGLLQLAQEMNAPPTEWILTANFETLEQPVLMEGQATGAGQLTGQVPEALLSQQAIAQAGAQIRLARANGRPDLLLTGGYKRDVDIDTPVASVQFDLPVFNRNRAAVAALQAEQEAARAAAQATQDRLAASLVLAQRTYRLKRAQCVETFKPLLDRATQISEISRAAYQAGGLDLLRVLDAERARVDAQQSYVRALEELHLSVVEVNHAEGVEP